MAVGSKLSLKLPSWYKPRLPSPSAHGQEALGANIPAFFLIVLENMWLLPVELRMDTQKLYSPHHVSGTYFTSRNLSFYSL
jgi:hypothetical protein